MGKQLSITNKELLNYFGVTAILYFLILLGAKLIGAKIAILIIPIIAIATAFIVSLTTLQFLFAFSFLCLPLSVNVNLFDSGINLMTPSEPIAAIAVIAFVFKILVKNPIPNVILKHPITLLIFSYLIVILGSTFFSSMLLVSVKAVVVKLCYISYYFLLGAVLSYQYFNLNKRSIFLYGIGMLMVIFYILFNHSTYNFSKDISGAITVPFFSDHTIYSACLAMILPYFIYIGFFENKLSKRFIFTIFASFIAIICAVGLFLAYSRAAWLSVIGTVIFYLFIYFGLRIRFFILLAFVISIFTWVNRDTIFTTIKQNKSDSNARNADIEMQTKSVTNISTDQSNAERVNRWLCAIRMFNERPITGYGLGTYQFQYLPYQRADEMTRISVLTPYNHKKGHGGTAHSEPLLVLSETGIFSFLIMFLLLGSVVYYGIKNYQLSGAYSYYSLVILAGFFTYLIHSFFNNFLDTDKAAALFWFFIATIMVIDIKHKEVNLTITD